MLTGIQNFKYLKIPFPSYKIASSSLGLCIRSLPRMAAIDKNVITKYFKIIFMFIFSNCWLMTIGETIQGLAFRIIAVIYFLIRNYWTNSTWIRWIQNLSRIECCIFAFILFFLVHSNLLFTKYTCFAWFMAWCIMQNIAMLNFRKHRFGPV